ncbi:MAG: patatin-like phospholipase family protein [Bacteroidales bacterium]|nr:patatin-like phospholipase family protein [Bacteroidales bacterium]MBR5670968.1 patatin-like phospholipase family protein [Bacteroidales bacterium]
MGSIFKKEKKYKLGIAFSGGGAKGASHCGALQALYEFGIKADIVAGTSAGSIAATMYAAGMSPVEITNNFTTMDFRDLLGTQLPKGGLFDSKPLLKHLQKIIPYENLEDLPIKTIVVATSIEKGRACFFESGEIAPRVAASCAIPVIYQPVKIDGGHYVDGGVLMNLPVSALRDRCKKVIALNVHQAGETPYRDSLYSIATRSFSLMFLSNTMEDAARADILIDMATSSYSAYDLSNIESLFYIGYNTAVRVLEENGYKRLMPQQKLAFQRKEKPHTKIDDIKERAQQMLAKSEELKEGARKLITGSKA